MAINLTAKAAKKTADRFTRKSVTEGLFTAEYEWVGAATVRVHTIDNLPLQTYDRTETSGSRFGALSEVGDTYQDMTVTDEKSLNGVIDKANEAQQGFEKSAAKVLKQNLDEVVIPYVDKYRLGKLAAGAGIKVYSQTISKSDVVEKIMTGNAAMSNENVPTEGRVLYMGYTNAIKLKLADQVVGIDSLGEKSIVNGAMNKIDLCQVRLVPDSYMPENVLFMIVKKGVACAPEQVKTYRILTENPNVDGANIQGHILHDCFVLNAKNKGVYVSYSSAAPSSET